MPHRDLGYGSFFFLFDFPFAILFPVRVFTLVADTASIKGLSNQSGFVSTDLGASPNHALRRSLPMLVPFPVEADRPDPVPDRCRPSRIQSRSVCSRDRGRARPEAPVL